MTARLNAYIPKDEPTHFVLAGLEEFKTLGAKCFFECSDFWIRKP